MRDTNSRFAELDRLSSQFAEAQAQAEYLEEFKKSKLAMLMKEAEKQGFTTSAAQEREARVNPDYIQVLEGLRSATENAIKAKWALKRFEMEFEAWRSKQATMRAEMQLSHG